jgi:hypothetical protein
MSNRTLICRSLLLVLLSCCASAPTSTGADETDTGRGRPGSDTGSGDRDTDSDDAGTESDAALEDDTTAEPDDTSEPDPDTSVDDTTSPDVAEPDATPADTGGGEDVVGPECSTKLRFIYVVDKDKRLHSFDPATGAFTLVGEVDCDEFLDTTPASMAMSTLGVAYINYSDSSLQRVSIDDASCTESGWTTGTDGFDRFGMTFVADSVGGAETLYIASEDTLASVDTASWIVNEIGTLPSQCELAGTGNGELWGFFPLESPPQIMQIDRDDATILTTYDLPPLPANLDTFAFTAWGGEFYVFYRVSGLGETTTVYRFDRATETLEQVAADTGINVVGAGVSICAPTSR